MADREQKELEQSDPEFSDEAGGGMGFLTKILIVVGILVFQIAAAYFGIQYLFLKDTATEVEPKAVEQSVEAVGPIMQMEDIVVNPAGSMGRRFLVVKVALELMGESVQDDVERQMPLINDGLIKLLASKNVEYLSNVAVRDSLREEMRLAINDRLPGGEGVSRLYFTGFILQ
jgi:flagellar basal body-associated protein FliL